MTEPITFDANVIRSATERIAEHIMSTADYTRRDRLWPSHHMVFATNPLSLAYGACGVAAFLSRVLRGVPSDVERWLRSHSITCDDYPPGLLFGTAGIAYQFYQLGMQELAHDVLELSYQSPLCFADPTMFCGIAGWGMVSLSFHRMTGEDYYLRRADEACDALLTTAEAEDGTLCWRHVVDDQIHFGYGYGASGIALFLLRAGVALDRSDAVAAAHRALDFDLSHRAVGVRGWAWPHSMDGTVRLPYFAHGAVGVGSSAVRVGTELNNPWYLEAAEAIADSTDVRWTILPSQLEGLSGIGEFMLDMYRLTGRVTYLDRAWRMANTILWYAVERSGGIAFPGRWLDRVSTDYASGSAGIGMFLLRLVDEHARFLVDFDAAGLALPSGGFRKCSQQ